MQSCTLWKVEEGKDEWGASTNTETIIGTVNIAINHVDVANIKNAIEYGEITHLGLTDFRGLKKGYILKSFDESKRYVVEKQPNEVGRLTQVYLKEVVV